MRTLGHRILLLERFVVASALPVLFMLLLLGVLLATLTLLLCKMLLLMLLWHFITAPRMTIALLLCWSLAVAIVGVT